MKLSRDPVASLNALPASDRGGYVTAAYTGIGPASALKCQTDGNPETHVVIFPADLSSAHATIRPTSSSTGGSPRWPALQPRTGLFGGSLRRIHLAILVQVVVVVGIFAVGSVWTSSSDDGRELAGFEPFTQARSGGGNVIDAQLRFTRSTLDVKVDAGPDGARIDVIMLEPREEVTQPLQESREETAAAPDGTDGAADVDAESLPPPLLRVPPLAPLNNAMLPHRMPTLPSPSDNHISLPLSPPPEPAEGPVAPAPADEKVEPMQSVLVDETPPYPMPAGTPVPVHLLTENGLEDCDGKDGRALASQFVAGAVATPLPTTDRPLVSFVMPCYNGLPFLRYAVEAIVNQSYRNIELIVVDDGSTDESLGYLWSVKDPRVRILQRAHEGLPHALNAGMRNATGRYVTWGSTDNIHLPTFAETLVDLLEDFPEAGFAHGQHVYIEDEKNEPDTAATPRWNVDTLPFDFLFNWKGLAAFMWRREVFDTVGVFNPMLSGVEDWDYWVRVLERYPIHPFSRKAIYYYRLHKGQMTVRLGIDKSYDTLIDLMVRGAVERHGGVNLDPLQLIPITALALNKRRAEAVASFLVAEGSLTFKLPAREFITNGDVHRNLYKRALRADPDFRFPDECLRVLNNELFPNGIMLCHRLALFSRFASLLSGSVVAPRNTFLNKCGMLGTMPLERATIECAWDRNAAQLSKEEMVSVSEDWIRATDPDTYGRLHRGAIVVFTEGPLADSPSAYNPNGFFDHVYVFARAGSGHASCEPVCSADKRTCVAALGRQPSTADLDVVRTLARNASVMRAHGLTWACPTALSADIVGATVVCSTGRNLDGAPDLFEGSDSKAAIEAAQHADAVIVGRADIANRLIRGNVTPARIRVIPDADVSVLPTTKGSAGTSSVAVARHGQPVAANAESAESSLGVAGNSDNPQPKFSVVVDATRRWWDMPSLSIVRFALAAIAELGADYGLVVAGVRAGSDLESVKAAVDEQDLTARVRFADLRTLGEEILRHKGKPENDNIIVLSVDRYSSPLWYEPSALDRTAMAGGVPIVACGAMRHTALDTGETLSIRATPSAAESEAVSQIESCSQYVVTAEKVRLLSEGPTRDRVRDAGLRVAARMTPDMIAAWEMFVYRNAHRMRGGPPK